MVHLSRGAQAFNVVAVAGHTKVGGGSCTCGDADCVYDPGECDGQLPGAIPAGGAGVDGAGVMLAMFALGLAARFLLKP